MLKSIKEKNFFFSHHTHTHILYTNTNTNTNPNPKHRHTKMPKQDGMKKSARGGRKGRSKAEGKQNRQQGIYSSKHVRVMQEKKANSEAKGGGQGKRSQQVGSE